jgi:beta-N-acetylglucosaminidase
VLERLGQDCERHDVELWFGVSPGKDFDHDNCGDYETLVGKFRFAVQHFRCRGLVLLMDDLPRVNPDPSKYKNLGSFQADLTNHCFERLRDDIQQWGLQFHFVPTPYSGDELTIMERRANKKNMKPMNAQQQEKIDYWQELHRLIDPSVGFFFTGAGVVSKTVNSCYVSPVRRFFQTRDILLWDNVPVNDYKPSVLFLSPYLGREAGIMDALDGVLLNPSPHLRSCLITMLTGFDFFNDPKQYTPSTSLRRAVRRVLQVCSLDPTTQISEANVESLAQVIEWAPCPKLNTPEQLPNRSRVPTTQLRTNMEALESLQLNSQLSDELQVVFQQVRAYCDCCDHSLTAESLRRLEACLMPALEYDTIKMRCKFYHRLQPTAVFDMFLKSMQANLPQAPPRTEQRHKLLADSTNQLFALETEVLKDWPKKTCDEEWNRLQKIYFGGRYQWSISLPQ